MKFLLLICVFLSSLAGNAQEWLELDSLPGQARDDGASFVIGNTAYCGTGVVPWYTLGDFYAFDFLTESWSGIASLPQGEQRQYASGFSSGNYGYIVCGLNDTDFLNDVWQYDPTNNTWTEKTALPAIPRSGAASFVINNIAYIIGGKTDSSVALNEVWAYDILNDSWENKKDLPFGLRWRSSAAASDSLGYLIFGQDENLRYCPELYEYNPLTDSWTKISDFPEGRNYAAMEYMNSKLVVFAGMDSSDTYLNDLWTYDLKKNSWTELNSLPAQGRRGGISFHNNTSIYYTTGLADQGVRLNETWKCVDPTSLEERLLEANFKLYPNPASNNLTLECPRSFISNNTAYLLFDSQGSLIKKEKINSVKTSLDISSLPTGLYFVMYSSEKEKVLKKLVKY